MGEDESGRARFLVHPDGHSSDIKVFTSTSTSTSTGTGTGTSAEARGPRLEEPRGGGA